MKLAMFLTILLSFNIMAETTIKTVKIFDGTRAYCRNKADAFRNQTGVYTIQGKSVEIVDDQIKINANVGFLLCKETAENKFAFHKVGPFHTYKFQRISLNNSDKVDVELKAKEVFLRTYVDGKYKITGESKITSTRSSSDISLTSNINEVLNDDQYLNLMTGEEIKFSLDVFMLRNVKVRTSTGKEFEDQRRSGSFRFHIKAKKDQNGIVQISLL